MVGATQRIFRSTNRHEIVAPPLNLISLTGILDIIDRHGKTVALFFGTARRVPHRQNGRCYSERQ